MEIKLRDVREDDVEVVYRWTQDPETRKNAPDPKGFSFESHKKWFQKKLNDKNAYIFIGQLNNLPVGQIRFEVIKENKLSLSIMIDQNYRGKGIGTELVNNGIRHLKNKIKNFNIIAKVRTFNEASTKIFKKNGFGLKNEVTENGVDYYIFEKIVESEK